MHPFDRKTRYGRDRFTWAANPFGNNKIPPEHQRVIKNLAHSFVERTRILDLVAYERDKEAVAYWNGAAQALRFAGCEALAESVAKLGVTEITPRGFQAVMEIALF